MRLPPTAGHLGRDRRVVFKVTCGSPAGVQRKLRVRFSTMSCLFLTPQHPEIEAAWQRQRGWSWACPVPPMQREPCACRSLHTHMQPCNGSETQDHLAPPECKVTVPQAVAWCRVHAWPGRKHALPAYEPLSTTRRPTSAACQSERCINCLGDWPERPRTFTPGALAAPHHVRICATGATFAVHGHCSDSPDPTCYSGRECCPVPCTGGDCSRM